ncbi:lysophospholipase L1 [Vibrio ishigakensis]|uniref:Lysophospholipase L1 n=1 Tax=Vibrio ishigakensis TaxID=1481914 RepID=A0A0B8NVH3_9VIBR|nr:GDSL-type esterase/lipase family protein [Vibrio ishigakensis]GAM55123.1 lysophospholipase L1 [Vibrio ishigakensis]
MDVDNQNCPVDKYLAQTRLFDELVQASDWVFLGDSITNAGRWGELFPSKRVANRGIDGDTIVGMLGRLDSVLATEPDTVFLLAGINDIAQDRTPERIMESYRKVVDTLTKQGVRVVLQSTILTNNPDWNQSVDKLNGLIEELARSQGLTLIDLNSLFAERGTIKSEATFDGVHLQGDMYLQWRDKLLAEAV